MKDICIIGGGLSGTLSAICLLKSSIDPLHIHIFEREKKQLNRGVAYSSDLSHQLLNVPAGHMSIFNDDHHHFLHWLKAGGHDYNADDFVPRYLFGTYLCACYDEARAANTMHKMTEVSAEVTAVVAFGGKYRVTTKNGHDPTLFDHVLVCTGNFPPADLPGLPDVLRDHVSYIANPWSGQQMEAVARDGHILVVGSGLTMADQVLSLRQRDFRGKITVVSRRGMLPRPHAAAAPYALKSVPDFARIGITGILQWVRSEVESTNKEGKDWRSVINALRDLTPTIWVSLNDFDRNSFIRHLRPFWEVHRHRLPVASHEAIAEMQRKGHLEVIAGRVRGGEPVGDKARVNVRLRGTGEVVQLTVDKIINCTGPQSHHKKVGSELFAQLRDSGIVTFDLLGMGIQVDDDSHAISAEGTAIPTFHVIGPPAKGTLWECTALREIRNQCHELAKSI